MQLPRFLWVSFELGRPFGTPGNADFQRRVLRTALELLERRDGPVILEDFPDEAPDPGETVSGAAWVCPVSFEPVNDDEHVRQTLDEIGRLAAWHEIYVTARGRSAPAASGLTPEQIVRGLAELAGGNDTPSVPSDLPLQEWVRLGCDDLRTWYMEAAQGQPGHATSRELQNWFWRQTALARLIGAAARHLVCSGDPDRKMFGLRAMVPRLYVEELMPGIEPFL